MDNRTLLVLAFLWQQTDEAHTASIADIAAYLAEHGISKPDARTIRKDIAQLVDFGIDIVSARGVQNQYHVASRHFDMPELRLLIDAVQSSRFITTRKSKALIDKLSVFASPYQNDLMRSGFYVDSRFKADNESIYITVDRIETVIKAHKKITFQYFDYAPDKQKVLRHGGQLYTVSPYALLWNNDAYYMIGYHDRREKVSTFRVDRITQLEILDEAAMERPADFDVSEYFTKEFSMLNGKENRVELLCENELMGNIIDRFGENVETELYDMMHFKVTVAVELSNNFYGWVFASGGKIKILSPDDAITEFRELMGQNKA